MAVAAQASALTTMRVAIRWVLVGAMLGVVRWRVSGAMCGRAIPGMSPRGRRASGGAHYPSSRVGGPAQCCILAAVKLRAGAPRGGALLLSILALFSAAVTTAQEQRPPQPVPPVPARVPEPSPEERAKAEANPEAATEPA